MATTYNNNLRIAEIGTGDQAGVWGNTTNYNLATLLTEAITGVASVTITGNQALTALDGVTDQARQAALILGGTPASNFTLYVPPVDKLYVIRNNTGRTATVSASTLANGTTPTGGTTITIPNGFTALIYCDGTNIADGVSRINNSLSVGGDVAVGGNGTFSGTGSVVVPVGTTAQQSGGQGGIRYNTTLSRFEGNNGSAWGGLGGGATGGGADQVFVQNQRIVTTNYTLTAGFNAMSVGPITVNAGVTVTVPSGARWVVL